MVANVARPTPHHGIPHEAEHRMLSSEAAQERLSQAASAGLGWPDSHSHWADIPTDFQSHGKWRNHQHSPPVEAEQYIPNKRQAPSYSRRPASSSYDFHEPSYDQFGFDEPTYHTVRFSFLKQFKTAFAGEIQLPFFQLFLSGCVPDLPTHQGELQLQRSIRRKAQKTK